MKTANMVLGLEPFKIMQTSLYSSLKMMAILLFLVVTKNPYLGAATFINRYGIHQQQKSLILKYTII